MEIPITEAPAPPKFKFSNLSIDPCTVMPRESVTISADVKNIGEGEEFCKVELWIRGELVADKTIILAGGESKRITFVVSKDNPGIYKFAVGDLTGIFKVRESIELKEPKKLIVPINYSSIQAAIDAANPRDTIFVQLGIYHENLVISKPISLIGECNQHTIIIGAKECDVILVLSDQVKISGFTIKNPYARTDSAGIRLMWSYNSIISNNILSARASYTCSAITTLS
jgi:hypothetical protein